MIKLWKIETIKLADVKPLSCNGRFIHNKNLNGLKNSLEKFGVVELPVFNKKLGHLISGHQRLSILREKGILETSMIIVEMSEEDEIAAGLTLNNPGICGEWTPAVIDLLESLETSTNEMYKDLNLDVLKISLKEFAPKIPPNPSAGDTNFDVPPKDVNDGLTNCPCCKQSFLLTASNVEVVES